MNLKSSNLIRSCFVIAAFVISLIILKASTAPYVYIYIGLIWFVITLVLSIMSKRPSIKPLWFNVSVVIIALTLFEAYLWSKSDEFYIATRVSGNRNTTHDFLGYAPVKGSKTNESKQYKDELIYDVTYTIDENGLRMSPPYEESNVTGCVLFFGCSFTFGLGVNDNETLPYQVGIKSHGRYRVYNFGFRGYGPHQMLSALEHKLVENVVDCNGSMFAIYQGIPDHINRSAGLSFWEFSGPRYVLGKNGEVMQAGSYNKISQKVRKHLNKSLIYRNITGNRKSIRRDEDLDLFVGIILASKRSFEKLYPGGEFHTIFWDNKDKNQDGRYKSDWLKVLNNLKGRGVRIHHTSEILPDYKNNGSKYDLSPHDAHPNALAHQIIAEYIVTNILEK